MHERQSLFVFGFGDGSDSFDGGAAGGWTDTIQLDGVVGNYDAGDWTITLDTGSIQSEAASGLTLSSDAAGTITMADGGVLTFTNVESIQW